MHARQRKGFRNIDWTTFSLYLGLVAIGLLMIYAVGFDESKPTPFFQSDAGKQTLWIGVSLFVFLIVSLLDWKFWQTFAYFFYSFSIILLVLVLFLGSNIKGATSWFSFGSFSFQPSELTKFGTSLAMAAFLSNYDTDLRSARSQLIAFGIFLLPVGLILAQPDAGSALIFFSFLILLFREGLSPNYYIVGFFFAAVFLLGLIFGPQTVLLGLLLFGLGILVFNTNGRKNTYLMLLLVGAAAGIYLARQGYLLEVIIGTSLLFLGFSYLAWKEKNARLVGLIYTTVVAGAVLAFASNYAIDNFLKPHQQDRINVWLRPQLSDPQGSLYNVLQSKMAISSGGLQGRGFLQGTMTKLNYVPEQSTDFIFCTIGEEQGFIGSFAIIALFLILLLRITVLAERQKSNFSRHYAYAVAGIIFFHFFINIGMTMGLLPIIGIPLPFISKGGSSLLGFTIMIAVLLKLDANRYRL